MPAPIQVSGEHVDLSPRVLSTSTVSASPAAGAETVICTTTALGDIATALGVLLIGTISFTVGTSGVSATIKIRRTNVSGTVIYNSGANTVTAAQLWTETVQGIDTGQQAAGTVYVMTLQIGSGAATSTVSAVSLVGLAI